MSTVLILESIGSTEVLRYSFKVMRPFTGVGCTPVLISAGLLFEPNNLTVTLEDLGAKILL